ncbi:MAG: GspE/PulE family protein [Ottowia sp.]|nr:GspE/PulE family protein [Ottowia sp.]
MNDLSTPAAQTPVDPGPGSSEEALGEHLLAAGKLSRSDLERAWQARHTMGGSLGQVLISLGLVSEIDMYTALAQHAGRRLVLADDFPQERPELAGLNSAFLLAHKLLPMGDVAADAPMPRFVSPNALDAPLAEALRLVFGETPQLDLGLDSEVTGKLQEWLFETENEDEIVAGTPQANEFIEQLRDMASEAPIIRRVNQILAQAVTAGASDVHIENYEDRSVVRIRVDGQIYPVDEIGNHDAPAVVSRIKILSRLDIAERRMPQDGRTRLRVHGRDIDVRVSTVPTMFGESVVMRLLEKNLDLLSLPRLQFSPPNLAAMRELLAIPHGVLLVTGPTGSGKSTTLYASLMSLEGQNLKILTVEDPVEYHLPWLNQVQVQPQIGLDFAHVLRSFLRQDPDVIMVGEMRDGETAGIAVQAALTGHLVLSTLHTNSAVGAIVRLINFGVPPYLITASVIGVLAQRLVRRLCDHCKTPQPPEQAQAAAASLGMDLPHGQVLYEAAGCDACRHTGYRGRLAVHELLVMNDDIRRAILQDGSSISAEQARYSGGNLLRDGATKVLQGLTTSEEVLRVVAQED